MVKNPPANAGDIRDVGSIPGSGRSPGVGNGNSLQYSYLENPIDLGSIPGVGKIPWRGERLPTPVFWPKEFHGLYSPWGCKELDTTERLHFHISEN